MGGFARENILQSGMNQIDNECLRICEPCGACSLPSLSGATISCIVFISLLYGMPHSRGSRSTLEGKMLGSSALLWQLVALVLKKLWKKYSKRISSKSLKLRSPLSLCLGSAKARRHIFKYIFDHLHRDWLTRTHPWEAEAETPRNKSPGQVYSVEVSLSQILVGSLLSTSRPNEPLLSLPWG